jgi:hypothetical protein
MGTVRSIPVEELTVGDVDVIATALMRVARMDLAIAKSANGSREGAAIRKRVNDTVALLARLAGIEFEQALAYVER